MGQWLVVAIACGIRGFCVRPAVPRDGPGHICHGLGPEARGWPASGRGASCSVPSSVTGGYTGRVGRAAQRRPFRGRRPNAGTGLELQIIAAVVVGGVAITGGRGTLLGSLIGVLLLGSIGPALVFLGTSLPAGLDWLGKPQWEKAIQGLIILLAVSSDAFNKERRG